jgi:4-amino-4-deoxy-L-arabinose transferase-like glycosyltransferase
MGYLGRIARAIDEAWRTPPAVAFGREGWAACLFILAIWAAACLPHLAARSFIYEEGRNAMMARDILLHGNWLQPSIFGARWAEKPDLLSWAGVAVAFVTGAVDEWAIRLPAMLSVLLTAFLVQRLARRYASLAASLFAAGSYLFCPMLLQKLTVAEPDTMVTALSLAAFVLWWNGEERGRVSPARWLGCGLLLTVLAMTKGPQPVAFFALGVGLFILLRRRWSELRGLIPALALPAIATIAWGLAVYQPGDFFNWLRYMRLAGYFFLGKYLLERARFIAFLTVEWLPSSLLLLPVLLSPAWRRRVPLLAEPIAFALMCYGAGGMAALLLWPGVGSRYAMPVTPAAAILAAFVAEAFWRDHRRMARRLAQTATGILVALSLFQLAFTNLGVPILADRFALSRRTGEAVTQAIRAEPAPVYCLITCDPRRLFYVDAPIVALDLRGGFRELTAPAWILTSRDLLPLLARKRPDLQPRIAVAPPDDADFVALRLDEPAPAP